MFDQIDQTRNIGGVQTNFRDFISRFNLIAVNALKPKIIASPKYAKVWLYSINTAETPVPKTLGRRDNA